MSWTADSGITADSAYWLADGSYVVPLWQVVSDLVNAGFVVTAQVGQWSSTVPIGAVITTNPAPGVTVPYGTKLTVYYSLGPQPTPVGGVVPNVVGLPWPAAAAAIGAVGGISLGNPTYVQSGQPAGTVLTQSVTGAQPYGTIVTVTVATTQVSYVADGSQTVPNPL